MHVLEHGEMTRFFDAVKATISHPEDIQPDSRAGRERYFASNTGPSKWLRVVVSFEKDPKQGEVVTAFGHRNDP